MGNIDAQGESKATFFVSSNDCDVNFTMRLRLWQCLDLWDVEVRIYFISSKVPSSLVYEDTGSGLSKPISVTSGRSSRKSYTHSVDENGNLLSLLMLFLQSSEDGFS